MVLTSPRRERQLRVLATVAVSSGGCSRLNEIVPADLLASEEKKQAHETLSDERRWKHPLTWRDTF